MGTTSEPHGKSEPQWKGRFGSQQNRDHGPLHTTVMYKGQQTCPLKSEARKDTNVTKQETQIHSEALRKTEELGNIYKGHHSWLQNSNELKPSNYWEWPHWQNEKVLCKVFRLKALQAIDNRWKSQLQLGMQTLSPFSWTTVCVCSVKSMRRGPK
jgi:hypothetical protein